jgi:hypothetical protein
LRATVQEKIMHPVIGLILLAPLAACTAAPAPAPDLPARQEAACRSVIAAHVGRPESDVSTRWLSETGGIAEIEARDGDRLHICDVDAEARVLGYIHPGA